LTVLACTGFSRHITVSVGLRVAALERRCLLAVMGWVLCVAISPVPTS